MRESLLAFQGKVVTRAIIMQEHLGGQTLPLYLFFKCLDSIKTGIFVIFIHGFIPHT